MINENQVKGINRINKDISEIKKRLKRPKIQIPIFDSPYEILKLEDRYYPLVINFWLENFHYGNFMGNMTLDDIVSYGGALPDNFYGHPEKLVELFKTNLYGESINSDIDYIVNLSTLSQGEQGYSFSSEDGGDTVYIDIVADETYRFLISPDGLTATSTVTEDEISKQITANYTENTIIVE